MEIADCLNRLRIGYVPVSLDLKHPTDRRLFCYYARKRNVRFEITRTPGPYDLVILPTFADITVWQKAAKDTKVVFNLEDSYLSSPSVDFREIFRGTAKFLARQHRYLEPSYRSSLKRMCSRSSAVLCSTEEQREALLEFCPNVHIMAAFQNDAASRVKRDYGAGSTFNFVWEGIPGNLITFKVIKDVLKFLRKRHRIAIHVVTDVEYPMGLGNIGMLPTKRLIRQVFDFDEVYIYEWNEELLSTIVTSCDLALIPIPLNVPLYAGKPANKLFLFWRMGVPVVTSATPVYRREMEACGLPMACASNEEWIATLERYIGDEEARRNAGQRGLAYANENYGEEVLLRRWDALFETLL